MMQSSTASFLKALPTTTSLRQRLQPRGRRRQGYFKLPDFTTIYSKGRGRRRRGQAHEAPSTTIAGLLTRAPLDE
jgi:hypothetical protein